ncbi:hypothetical protein HRbin40_00234 [bacterium HR40]|nr:hypothetical protein HRbin40_00234 [bacterium HR40]
MRRPILLGLVLLLAGCTAQERNYEPLVDLQASGRTREQYAYDLRECQTLASQRSPQQQVGTSAAVGAAAGAAAGTLVGVIAGKPAHGLWQGAALGGLGGLGYGLYSSWDEQNRAVANCLRGRGYVVVRE